MPAVYEFYAEAGAPEGALYVDGVLVGTDPRRHTFVKSVLQFAVFWRTYPRRHSHKGTAMTASPNVYAQRIERAQAALTDFGLLPA